MSKIYKYDYNNQTHYLEIKEKESDQGTNAEKCKVNRYITDKTPEFSYDGYKYFLIARGAFYTFTEIDEDEFSLAIADNTEKAFSDPDLYKGDAYQLTPRMISCKNSYLKTFGEDKLIELMVRIENKYTKIPVTNPSIKLCTCDFNTVMNQGCQCGGE